MKKLVTAAVATAAMLSAGSASAIILTLDSFNDVSVATSGNSSTVVDVLNDDLFDTRTISASGDPSAQVSVNDAGNMTLNYEAAANDGSYDIEYMFNTPVDLTAGKGAAGAGDVFQIELFQNDFPIRVSVAVNGGPTTFLGETPFFVSTPTLVDFDVADFGPGVNNVTDLAFNLLPVAGPGSTVPANQADGILNFFQFDVVAVPVPGTILMMAAGLFGLRRARKAA